MFMNSVRRNVPTILGKSTRTSSLRCMSSHGGPPPVGFEAVVRKYLPEDKHIVMATLGFYAVLITGIVMKPSSAEAEAPKTTEGSSSDVIPSCLDDEWAEWIEIGDNLSKWEASFDE